MSQWREEFEVLGMPFDHRGARADEQLELYEACFTQDRPSYDGRYYQIPEIGFAPTWARPLESGSAQQFLVATELFDAEQHSLHGLATGSSPIEAAARSTLHALNRTIAPQLTGSH